MDLTGKVHIAATRENVWRAMNDAQTLMDCIPGCEEVEITSETERHVRLLVKAGPVRARFVGKITLSDVVMNSACVMNFEGSGGAAGMATGKSSVQLSDEAAGTLVTYTATASVGGKLGQIGARMLDAASKQMADQFFERLSQALVPTVVPAAITSDTTSGVATSSTAGVAGVSTIAKQSPRRASPPLGEGTRILWFVLGCLATGFGFLLASHLY